MSTGRYSQRGWAFQGFAFRPWGLAGATETVVTPGTQERVSIEVTSKRRIGIEMTSRERTGLQAISKQRIGIEV